RFTAASSRVPSKYCKLNPNPSPPQSLKLFCNSPMAANHDSSWDEWLDEAISKLESTKLLRSLRPITLNKQQPPCSSSSPLGHAYKVFDEMQQWDRSSVEVSVSDSTFHSWLRNAASVGEEDSCSGVEEESGKFKKLLLFSGNDYLGLSSHPTIANAAAKVCCRTVFFVLPVFLPIWRSNCSLKKKVVVTDSMDGDFAPMTELANLRKIHGFILIIDDAHGTFVCGKDGSGVAEQFNCESDVDICIGTLSKAAGCHGGFVACSSGFLPRFLNTVCFTFNYTAAAVIVARKEAWRRRQVWKRVQDFRDLTGIPITSPIISLVVGSEERALQASRYLLESGFHVTAIRPPTVPSNSCRFETDLLFFPPCQHLSFC
ncbi:8-amino-7-oxononanoate synthase, partial [Linum grandiflorum]